MNIGDGVTLRSVFYTFYVYVKCYMDCFPGPASE